MQKIRFILILFLLGFQYADAQTVQWLSTDTVFHDRRGDIKWWELYVDHTGPVEVKVDSSSPSLQVFMSREQSVENMAQLRQQRNIKLTKGFHHLFVFHNFTEAGQQEAVVRVLVTSGEETDTTYLRAVLHPARFKADQHPADQVMCTVFPTRGSGLFKIDMQPLRNAEVIVYDTLRTAVHETDWNGRLLDLRALQPGRYIIQVNNYESPVIIADRPLRQIDTPNTTR